MSLSEKSYKVWKKVCNYSENELASYLYVLETKLDTERNVDLN